LPTFETNEQYYIKNRNHSLSIWQDSETDKVLYKIGICFKTADESVYFGRRSIVLVLVDRMMLEFNVKQNEYRHLHIFDLDERGWVVKLSNIVNPNIFNHYFYDELVAMRCLEFLKEQEFEDGSKYIDYLILKNPLT
jgi:hypothetical protein